MKRLKIIYKLGIYIFIEPVANKDYPICHISQAETLDWFLKIYPQAKKTDILELLEYILLGDITGLGEFQESDQIFDFPFSKHSKAFDYTTGDYRFNEPIPSFESDYFSILGEFFLAGYVDFVVEEPNETYLSHYKEDKYQAWIYFRDNFLYKNAFNRDLEEHIMIYEGKEYNFNDCPTRIENGITTLCGYDATVSGTSWDTPQYWSQYNVFVARTQKGTKYFNEILAPRFYNKYKDLEVEIDESGNIVRWLGRINR